MIAEIHHDDGRITTEPWPHRLEAPERIVRAGRWRGQLDHFALIDVTAGRAQYAYAFSSGLDGGNAA